MSILLGGLSFLKTHVEKLFRNERSIKSPTKGRGIFYKQRLASVGRPLYSPSFCASFALVLQLNL